MRYLPLARKVEIPIGNMPPQKNESLEVTFKILIDGEKAPNGFQFINCHLVFDIKMEDFKSKA